MNRRTVGALVAAVSSLVLLGACGSDDDRRPAASDASTPSVRTVTHEAGTTTNVPAEPKRIVALDEYAALNMMEIGVTPAVVFGGLSSEVGAVILEEEGVELIAAPTMITDPNFEAIAAQNPDLIVLTTPGESISNTYEKYSDIAPTIVLPYEKPWREMLDITGAAFGREKQAAAVAETLQTRVEQVARSAEQNAGKLSVLGSFQNVFYSPAMINPMSVTLQAIGFERPEAEAKGKPSGASTSTVRFSPERLTEHDAGTLVLLDGSIYDADAIESIPTFKTLAAARNDRVFRANGELWSANFPLGTWWMLDDIETILSSDTAAPLGTIDDAADRWKALRTAIGS